VSKPIKKIISYRTYFIDRMTSMWYIDVIVKLQGKDGREEPSSGVSVIFLAKNTVVITSTLEMGATITPVC